MMQGMAMNFVFLTLIVAHGLHSLPWCSGKGHTESTGITDFF